MRQGKDAVCVGCRCTWDRACPGGCAWVSDGEVELPVCTSCAQGLNGKRAQDAAFAIMREGGIDPEAWLEQEAGTWDTV